MQWLGLWQATQTRCT